MSGFFKVTREEFHNPMFEGSPYTKREAYLYLKSVAEFSGPAKDCFARSERQLATQFKWERSAVHRFLHALNSKDLIEPATEPKVQQECSAFRIRDPKQTRTVSSSERAGTEPKPNHDPNQQPNQPIDKDLRTQDQEKNPLPPSLDFAEIKTALAEWRIHLKQLNKPVTALSWTKLINKLEKLGKVRAIVAIDRSIEKGWGGVYEEEERTTPRQHAETADAERREVTRKRQAEEQRNRQAELSKNTVSPTAAASQISELKDKFPGLLK